MKKIALIVGFILFLAYVIFASRIMAEIPPARRPNFENTDVLPTESGYLISLEAGRHSEILAVSKKQALALRDGLNKALKSKASPQ